MEIFNFLLQNTLDTYLYFVLILVSFYNNLPEVRYLQLHRFTNAKMLLYR